MKFLKKTVKKVLWILTQILNKWMAFYICFKQMQSLKKEPGMAQFNKQTNLRLCSFLPTYLLNRSRNR